MTRVDLPAQFAADRLSVTAATERLVTSISELSDEDIRCASLLPGWTIGHCLTHLARNADGICNLVTWAISGQRTPMYPSMADRDADIESGAGRGANEHRDDIASTALRLDAAFDQLANAGADALERLVIFGAPPSDTPPNTPAVDLAFARLREVTIHHADLGLADFGYADFDEAFTARTMTFVEARSGSSTVSGPAVDLLTWRLGRGTPSSLHDADGNPPGEAPAW